MSQPTDPIPTASVRRRRFPSLRLLGLAAAVAVATTVGAVSVAPARPEASPPPPTELTVVELFTSQGCSSCPPANANLLRLSGRPDILALSFGVTYWDQLGWRDTFGQPAFTARQRDYQRGLGNGNVWTPQIVVDGREDVVGGRMSEIEREIARHRAFTGPTIRFQGRGVGLAGGEAPRQPADVWLVRYEPRPIEVPVARGENTGRTLPHANVVRELVKLGQWRGQTVGFATPVSGRPGLRTAILVQATSGGPILAAARQG